jgi:hypothetical protein
MYAYLKRQDTLLGKDFNAIICQFFFIFVGCIILSGFQVGQICSLQTSNMAFCDHPLSGSQWASQLDFFYLKDYSHVLS